MAGRYDEREIWDASANVRSVVSNIQTEHASNSVAAHVVFWLKALHSDGPGPTVEIDLVIPEMPGASLAEVEKAAITAAHELLAKFASHTVDDLLAARQRQFDYDRKPYVFEMPAGKTD